MGIRAIASNVRQRATNARRNWLLARGLRELAMLPPGSEPSDHLLQKLARAWANEGWSASPAYLRAVVRYFGLTRGAVVECGSGLSTLVMGTLARNENRRVVALEHHEGWARRVQNRAKANGLKTVEVCLTQLRSHGGFDWYAPEGPQLPEQIGLVICDGPPASTRGGRYGAIPVLLGFLVPGCVVLLDDTQRPEEQQIIRRWCSEFGLQLVGESGTFTALRVGSAGGSFQSRAAR